MAKKRKTLPKDFEELLHQSDIDSLKAVFDSCDINARGGVFKQTALAFNECPDELARWLLANGADIEAGDSYGDPPLCSRAGHYRGRLEILLELGANVNAGAGGRGTALHYAADVGHCENVKLLIANGANPEAPNKYDQTPLEYALQRCSNLKIAGIAEVAGVLFEPKPAASKSFISRMFGSKKGQEPEKLKNLKDYVTRIGTDFEFHRAGFNPELLEEAAAGLEKLYALFDVPPVARRIMHDGRAPIEAKAGNWQDQHQELWELLIPSNGAADTVQGEVIRISGRIADELDRNGAVNWNADYKKMANAFLFHVATGNSLTAALLDETANLIQQIQKRQGDTERLCEIAVQWVKLNPIPLKLPAPDYKR
ncbi:ankyrin repeat domain-containing protein [Sphingorhabdus arenilitoris]|uniref:Ankyrin repeat domain-containing protein n=1 Tax=Sphingorhabdus arenilitoris TaxID=1490041 RepID=A0ABV8RGW3_9SPHN